MFVAREIYIDFYIPLDCKKDRDWIHRTNYTSLNCIKHDLIFMHVRVLSNRDALPNTIIDSNLVLMSIFADIALLFSHLN